MEPVDPESPRIIKVDADGIEESLREGILALQDRADIIFSSGSAAAQFSRWPKRRTASNTNQHVLRLTILRGLWQRKLVALLSRLPGAVQAFVIIIWPGWFLPDTVVLKTPKPDWDEEFDTEKEVYDKLKALQGNLIPIFSFIGRHIARGLEPLSCRK